MHFLASVSPGWLPTCHLLGPQPSCRGLSLTWLAYPFVRKLETQKLLEAIWDCIHDKLLLFSCSVVSNSLQPRGLQHTRLPCPSPSPRACSNSCPLSWWCHPTISFSVVTFSSCLQSFPTSGSFLMSQLFKSHGQSIGASASASALPMNFQDWFPLGLTSLILQSKGLSRVFSNTTVWKHHFFNAHPSLWSSSHICTWLCQVGDDNWHIGESVSCSEGREASSSLLRVGVAPMFPECLPFQNKLELWIFIWVFPIFKTRSQQINWVWTRLPGNHVMTSAWGPDCLLLHYVVCLPCRHLDLWPLVWGKESKINKWNRYGEKDKKVNIWLKRLTLK